MTYKELKAFTEGKNLPLVAKNEHDEVIIVKEGNNGEQPFFEVSTYQKNDWVRVNCYYEYGTVDETYEK